MLVQEKGPRKLVSKKSDKNKMLILLDYINAVVIEEREKISKNNTPKKTGAKKDYN